jgi:tartrate-resistant acid phosphatase type 5
VVASSLGDVAAAIGASFVLSTGDNVYEAGISSATDPLWAATFTNVYTHAALSDVPFFSVLGNHDWLGNVTAQVHPTRGVCCVAPAGGNGANARVDGRWRAGMSFQASPSRSRSDHWAGIRAGSASSVNPPLLSLVYVDTSPWVSEYRALTSMDWAAAGLIPRTAAAPGTPASAAAWAAWEDAQVNRLTAALAASDARWKIVVGHHAIHSYGEHGSQPELARLDAALRAGGAVAYVNGHDHDLQLIQPDVAAAAAPLGPVYLTSGAGSATRGDVAAPGSNGTLLHSWSGCGFHAIEVGWDTLRIHAHDGVSGKRLFTHARAWQPPPACAGAGSGAAADVRCRASAGAGR